ncbi:molybdenum ABC transporter periplasmic molybdate-binding protein [Mycolicibacterium flavescens]|uniref:molybdate ABC transporter substrate-binding protein n=1 Tax=Mycobacterium neumannii TaxID=2048551 RepID=UPI000F6EDEB1|nr:molybdate ABC transporter substrate-binding protein [Mycobacterium neumannii]VEG38971.1 molybdenum ABC transporter periplasmic molybdate-binding protein [Mycolicibacterium flavescens]
MKPLSLLAALLLTLATGCGQGSERDSLMVFAAASLNAAFTEIGAQFEKDHPGTRVKFSFAGSSDLATQLMQGARADVFASADTVNMDKVADAGLLAGDPVNFASNTMVIVVAAGNPKEVRTIRDLARPGINVVVCAPQVACGSATRRVEVAAGVDLSPVSEESSVTDVLNKVTSGQADAGIVYVTDARGAGARVTTVPVPEATDIVNVYPIATLEDSSQRDLAPVFVDAVTGDAGRRVLGAAGFGKP